MKKLSEGDRMRGEKSKMKDAKKAHGSSKKAAAHTVRGFEWISILYIYISSLYW